MLEHLRDHHAHETRHIARLRDCGDYLVFRDYYTVDDVRLTAANFCKQHLICPLCAIRRGSKYVERYLERLRVISHDHPNLRPYLVTYTVRNGFDLLERFEHLRASMQRLHDRRRDVLKKGRGYSTLESCAGAVWSFEVTNIGNGWHPHTHAIYLAPCAPSQSLLRAEWEQITGDSHQVDVRPIHGEAEGFVEVFKYALKFSSLALADNVEAWQTLRGRRLIASFGLFRGVHVPDSLHDEPLDDLPYLELFYRYMPGSGYSLQRCTQS